MQEYWSRLPGASSGNLPDPGIKPTSLMSPALAGEFFTTSTSGLGKMGYVFMNVHFTLGLNCFSIFIVLLSYLSLVNTVISLYFCLEPS